MGDYAAQAVINTMLFRAFPEDRIVGEEDAEALRGPSASTLRTRVVDLANEALTKELALGDQDQWGIGPGQAQTEEQILTAIDRGNYGGARTGRECYLYSQFYNIPVTNTLDKCDRNVDP